MPYQNIRKIEGKIMMIDQLKPNELAMNGAIEGRLRRLCK